MFDCPRFDSLRTEMSVACGIVLNAENVVQEMCANELKWNAVNSAVTRILTTLQQKWRVDQRVDTVDSGILAGTG